MNAGSNKLGDDKKYVFNKVLDIFGKDLEPRINIFLTHCDGSQPLGLNCLKSYEFPINRYFNFNNTVFYNDPADRFT